MTIVVGGFSGFLPALIGDELAEAAEVAAQWPECAGMQPTPWRWNEKGTGLRDANGGRILFWDQSVLAIILAAVNAGSAP